MTHEAMEYVGDLMTNIRWSCTLVYLVYQHRVLVDLTILVEGHYT